MTTLDKIRKLCDENLTTISKLEKHLGFGRGTITKWNKSKPGADKLNKVAKYFGVTDDYLLGNTNDPHEIMAGPMRSSIKLSAICNPTIEKAPTEAGAMMIRESAQEYSAEPTKKDLRYALSGEVTDLTDEQLDEIINYAKYVSAKRKDNK